MTQVPSLLAECLEGGEQWTQSELLAQFPHPLNLTLLLSTLHRLLPARLQTKRSEGRRTHRSSLGRPAPARARPRPAPSRWLPSAPRLLRLGGEAPRVAKGSGSRERRSLTYFQLRDAHAYWASALRAGDSRGIARAWAARPGQYDPGVALQGEPVQTAGCVGASVVTVDLKFAEDFF